MGLLFFVLCIAPPTGLPLAYLFRCVHCATKRPAIALPFYSLYYTAYCSCHWATSLLCTGPLTVLLLAYPLFLCITPPTGLPLSYVFFLTRLPLANYFCLLCIAPLTRLPLVGSGCLLLFHNESQGYGESLGDGGLGPRGALHQQSLHAWRIRQRKGLQVGEGLCRFLKFCATVGQIIDVHSKLQISRGR